MRPCRLVAAVAAVAAVVGGCSSVDDTESYRELDEQTAASRGTFEAIPVLAADAYRLVAAVDGTEVEVIQTSAGVWQPGAGATAAAAAFIVEAQDLFFPTLAYRRLDVDRSDPEFGLDDPRAIVTVETRTAQTFDLAMGNPTLTGGGYYAALDGDPWVYIVIPQIYDYAVSIVQGERIERPPDPRFVAALDRIESTGESEEVTNPWLKQVIEFEPN